jgi:hypothetical protein
LSHGFGGFRGFSPRSVGPAWAVVRRRHVTAGVHDGFLMAGMWKRERKRPGSHNPLLGHVSSDLRPPAGPQMLKVPAPPSSATGWGPSLQHRGLWGTFQITAGPMSKHKNSFIPRTHSLEVILHTIFGVPAFDCSLSH